MWFWGTSFWTKPIYLVRSSPNVTDHQSSLGPQFAAWEQQIEGQFCLSKKSHGSSMKNTWTRTWIINKRRCLWKHHESSIERCSNMFKVMDCDHPPRYSTDWLVTPPVVTNQLVARSLFKWIQNTTSLFWQTWCGEQQAAFLCRSLSPGSCDPTHFPIIQHNYMLSFFAIEMDMDIEEIVGWV